jgi:hypothetical protein
MATTAAGAQWALPASGFISAVGYDMTTTIVSATLIYEAAEHFKWCATYPGAFRLVRLSQRLPAHQEVAGLRQLI